MRSSWFGAKLATTSAALTTVGVALATVGAATATAPPTSEPVDHDLSAEEQAAFEVEVEFTQCMRDHGIEGLPEPQVTEDGFVLVGFPLVLPEDWNAAHEACQFIFDDATPDEAGARRRMEADRPGRRLRLCRRQRVLVLGARGRPGQGRAVPRRWRRLFDAIMSAFTAR